MVSQVFARDIFDKEVEKVETQYYYLSQSNNAVTNAVNELQFNLGTAEIKDLGIASISAFNNTVDNRTDFVADRDCSVELEASCLLAVLDRQIKIVIVKSNGTEFIMGCPNGYSNGPSAVGSTFTLLTGDYFYIGTSVGNGENASGDFATLNVQKHRVQIKAEYTVKQKISDI